MFFDLRHTVLSEASIRAVIADQKNELKKGSNRNFATWATLDRVVTCCSSLPLFSFFVFFLFVPFLSLLRMLGYLASLPSPH